jgi:hypothetical protein
MKWKTTFWRFIFLTVVSFIIIEGCKPKPKVSALAKAANPPGRPTILSVRVDEQTAKALHDYYDASPAALSTVDLLGIKIKLEGFKFDTSDLKEILNRVSTIDGTTDKIALKFGLDPAQSKRWRLIAYAMKNNVLIETPDASNKFTNFYNIDNKSPLETTRLTDKQGIDSRALYVANKLLMTIDDQGKADSLLGFAFNADQINEIIYSNASGKVPNKVVIYLGLVKAGPSTFTWHVIAYGEKGGNLLDYSTLPVKGTTTSPKTLRAPSIFDKATPCPPCTP